MDNEKDNIIHFIEKKYHLSTKEAEIKAKEILKYPDLVHEFFNYIKTGKYKSHDGSKIQISEYTAEYLHKECRFPPLLAYQFMAWLYQNPNLSTKEICFAVGKAL
jgi:hypothetical protein